MGCLNIPGCITGRGIWSLASRSFHLQIMYVPIEASAPGMPLATSTGACHSHGCISQPRVLHCVKWPWTLFPRIPFSCMFLSRTGPDVLVVVVVGKGVVLGRAEGWKKSSPTGDSLHWLEAAADLQPLPSSSPSSWIPICPCLFTVTAISPLTIRPENFRL